MVACKDCPPGTRRPAPHPGPRCATHDRERRARAREDSWEGRLRRTYNLTVEQYWALYKAQGGRCYGCRRATGKSKRLSVDHDHRCCPGRTSCGRCVRGLLCGVCNKLLGHLRDDPDAFLRFVEYIRNPPAFVALA